MCKSSATHFAPSMRSGRRVRTSNRNFLKREKRQVEELEDLRGNSCSANCGVHEKTKEELDELFAANGSRLFLTFISQVNEVGENNQVALHTGSRVDRSTAVIDLHCARESVYVRIFFGLAF